MLTRWYIKKKTMLQFLFFCKMFYITSFSLFICMHTQKFVVFSLASAFCMSQRIRLCKRISVVQRISGVFLLLLFVRIFCLRVHFLRVFVVLNIINCIVIAISVCILYRIRIFDQILLGRCFSTKDKSVSSDFRVYECHEKDGQL